MKKMSFFLLAAVVVASYAIGEDNATVKIEAEGNKIEIKPDGSKTIQRRDGTMVQINPDGSKLVTKPDGTTVEIKADGSKTIRQPDGTTVEVKPDSEMKSAESGW